jgi:hypothetical protein
MPDRRALLSAVVKKQRPCHSWLYGWANRLQIKRLGPKFSWPSEESRDENRSQLDGARPRHDYGSYRPTRLLAIERPGIGPTQKS